MRSRAASYGNGPRWSHQHFGPNSGTNAATRDDERTRVSACELQSKYLGDGTSARETHGPETVKALNGCDLLLPKVSVCQTEKVVC